MQNKGWGVLKGRLAVLADLSDQVWLEDAGGIGRDAKYGFYHGPDVSRAMVMWPPCWKMTDNHSMNRPEQTYPSPAEGRAPP